MHRAKKFWRHLKYTTELFLPRRPFRSQKYFPLISLITADFFLRQSAGNTKMVVRIRYPYKIYFDFLF